jgi:chromosome segregation ATPase
MAEEVVELVTSTSPDFVHSLSCIEEEGNESPGSGSGQGGSAVSSPHVETVPVDEPLDEKLFRLQNRVISMLEMQKRSQEPQKARRKPTQTAGVGRNGSAAMTAGVKRQGQDAPAVAEREGQLKISKSSREMQENVERSPSAEADWRNTPGGAVQHRKNLAKHYKEQLELLEHEEKELQHQMNLRQQLRLVLHDEAQQCERAERACLEPESELAAHNAHEKEATEQLVEENRQLDLLRRQLEEQLRISEQRRLQLERENQMLQKRPSRPVEPNGATAERRAPPGPGSRAPVSQKAPAPAALRTKSPRSEAEQKSGVSYER